MHKTLKLIIGMAFVSILSMFSSCGNKKNVGTILGFEDENITCNLESVYKMPMIAEVKDSLGNTFPVETSVKDSLGNDVIFIGHQFIIDDINGYTVTYKINANGKEILKKINISVVDKLKPRVNFLQTIPTVYNIDDVVELPLAKASRFDGSSVDVNYKLYHLENGELVEKSFTNDFKYTCEENGKYFYHAVANDINGKSTIAEISFFVAEKVRPNEVECFSNPNTVYVNGINLSSRGDSPVTWIDEYDGHNGVAKVTFKNVYDMINCQVYPEQDKEKYDDYEYRSFTVDML